MSYNKDKARSPGMTINQMAWIVSIALTFLIGFIIAGHPTLMLFNWIFDGSVGALLLFGGVLMGFPELRAGVFATLRPRRLRELFSHFIGIFRTRDDHSGHHPAPYGSAKASLERFRVRPVLMITSGEERAKVREEVTVRKARGQINWGRELSGPLKGLALGVPILLLPGVLLDVGIWVFLIGAALGVFRFFAKATWNIQFASRGTKFDKVGAFFDKMSGERKNKNRVRNYEEAPVHPSDYAQQTYGGSGYRQQLPHQQQFHDEGFDPRDYQ